MLRCPNAGALVYGRPLPPSQPRRTQMNFGRSRKHLRRLAGVALSLSVLTNCFSFADTRSRASVSVEKKKAPVTTASKPSKADESVKQQVKETFGNLPLSFEAN